MGANAKEFLQDREDWSGDVYQAPIELSQLEYIHSLLERSNIDHEERERIARQSEHYTEEEAHKMIIRLSWNQLDPIPSGFSFSQSDIIKYQDKHLNE